jgi:plasmid stability protein
MATLQVRSIDDQLYDALGRKAAKDNRSISQEVVAILKEHLAQPMQHKSATEKFLELCGSWKDKKTAKEISLEIRKSRKSKTRFQGSF